MGLIQLLTIAGTVWKVATKRFGPVGSFLVTIIVMVGIVYLRPWLAENVPAVGRIVGNSERREESVPVDRVE
jgi:hypothetical protein